MLNFVKGDRVRQQWFVVAIGGRNEERKIND